ncbi:MAG TPA: phospholipase D-like domain-containing protein [Acidimicrobiales bacterium]|nr:phospholipase D-like domain-containing protein [Acidimicrobiales bacterium]
MQTVAPGDEMPRKHLRMGVNVAVVSLSAVLLAAFVTSTTIAAPRRRAAMAHSESRLAPLPRKSGSLLRTLLVEPTDGLGRIYSSITAARKSIDLEMYELDDSKAEGLLAQAAARGVDVRVILDRHLEGSRNEAAYTFLSSRHVEVTWAPPAFYADHEKAMVVDTREAWIMTLNLTSEYYSSTRDFAVLDTDPADVRAIAATFDADFSGTTIAPPAGTDLVWSPSNSSRVLLSMIAAARSSLWVESEELSDPAVVAALVAAARRDVSVHVIMNDTREYATAFDELVAAGGKVGTYPGDRGLYIHAKVIVADLGSSSEEAFLGSENLSSTSLHDNRELGVTTKSVAVVARLATVLERDFARSAAWRVPGAQESGPWCAATVGPANDGYAGDVDVHIHSNQPHTDATASDATDSYSHETDAAGYTYVTLWHQRPGEHINVTVGEARCSATA